MEESVSGFKQEGGWVAVVEHGERITAALEAEGISGAEFEDWDEWRPKAEERFGEEVNEKTAEQASTSEGDGEKAGKTPLEDISTAGDSIGGTIQELEDGDLEDAAEEGQEAVEHATRAADTAARKGLRAVENTVYKHVMTKVSPCYFDNALVSANIDRIGSGRPQYRFEVNVNDDSLKRSVSDLLAEYEDIERWRIETEKNTRSVAISEGIESVTEE
ncbi:hypothetical protein A4G99_15515 [Haladaptatus sp. R4]|uniref:DUF5828 family protein n=1 Tax=Haladaptatus sp. R4 TaxID=1679489 RepID=UPI0007B4A604|nr:DUF5828 family protein [Haladaptatus sp. R4]KZN23406.1 hypothetical protein A4G99_15515 [Haladaptatus sp. R4]